VELLLKTFDLRIFVVLMPVGFVAGRLLEPAHYASI
jgi:hypothetical protein